jgi:hypothetical protein
MKASTHCRMRKLGRWWKVTELTASATPLPPVTLRMASPTWPSDAQYPSTSVGFASTCREYAPSGSLSKISTYT